jgi:hypothetical protein
MGAPYSDSIPWVGVAGGLLAVACCAGLPLVGTIVRGATVAEVIGGRRWIVAGHLGARGRGAFVSGQETPAWLRAAGAEGGAVNVELLYFDGCPNHEALVPHLDGLLRSVPVPVILEVRRIPDELAAQRERFLGSPTIRVDGRDVEPGAEQRDDFGLTCRLYRLPTGRRGAPLDEWVLDALARVRA